MHPFAQRNDCWHNLKENTVNDRIFSLDVTKALLSLSQTTAGILGKVSLLYRYLFLCHTQCRLRTTDLILQHLTLANSLVILSKGVPHTVAALGLKYFFNDFCMQTSFVHSKGGQGHVHWHPLPVERIPDHQNQPHGLLLETYESQSPQIIHF